MARNYQTLKLIALCLAFVINFLMLFYKVLQNICIIKKINPFSFYFQAMPIVEALSDTESGDEGEAEDEGDGDDNEMIVMDPKKHFLIYLLRSAAFLHSIVAFLMMVSYYKLKVRMINFSCLI